MPPAGAWARSRLPPAAADGIELEVHARFGESEIAADAPLYLLVEKILERGEHLPAWPVDGTVGYDFTNLVNGVLIDGRNERFFTNLYQRVIDDVSRRISV